LHWDIEASTDYVSSNYVCTDYVSSNCGTNYVCTDYVSSNCGTDYVCTDYVSSNCGTDYVSSNCGTDSASTDYVFTTSTCFGCRHTWLEQLWSNAQWCLLEQRKRILMCRLCSTWLVQQWWFHPWQ